MTRNSPSLNEETPEGFLEINPHDALEIGVKRGEAVRVASRRGNIVVRVDLYESQPYGLYAVPTYEAVQTSLRTGLRSYHKIPEYKVVLCRWHCLKRISLP
jgi:predicted molibdopterin-dependent oxidoreductase YjgC